MTPTGTKKVGKPGNNPALALLLRIGLVGSLCLLLAGVVLVVVGSGSEVVRHTSLSEMPGALIRLEPGGFFSLGFLVLVLTPAALVVALAVSFARTRRWLFAGLSVVVLGVLVLSGVLGFGG